MRRSLNIRVEVNGVFNVYKKGHCIALSAIYTIGPSNNEVMYRLFGHLQESIRATAFFVIYKRQWLNERCFLTDRMGTYQRRTPDHSSIFRK